MSTVSKVFLGAALLATGAMTACSFEFSVGGQNLNIDRLHEFLETEVESQVGLPIASVNCPSPIPIEEGNQFECELSGERGATIITSVTQTSEDGDVHFEVTDSSGIIDLAIVESQISSRIQAPVDCGQPLLEGLTGDTYECYTPNAGGTPISIEILSDDGDFRWNIN